MAKLKTETRDLGGGRWQLITFDTENVERFVSSVELHSPGEHPIFDLLDVGRKLGDASDEDGEGPFETIMHDENGWKRTPKGNNAVQYATKADCLADRPRILAQLFGAVAAGLN